MKTISIIIPAYNEEQFIARTIEKVIHADTFTLEKEILVVDDASQDKTADVLERLKQKYPDVIQIYRHETNRGKGSALKTGFTKSKGDIVLIQDADLEYSPEDYPVMLKPFFKSNADVVYGSRFITHKPHRVLYFWHSIINKALTFLSNMATNINLTDIETGYKAFKGDLIRSIAPKLESQRFGFEPEITARIAKIPDIKIYEVGISYTGRTYAEGKKIGWKDGVEALWCIVKYNFLR